MGPDRRPGPVALGQVAPLTAGPGEEQDRLHHLAARDLGRRAAAAGRVEQVGDQLPLLSDKAIAKLMPAIVAARGVSFGGTNLTI
jgi:hypothetical protein